MGVRLWLHSLTLVLGIPVLIWLLVALVLSLAPGSDDFYIWGPVTSLVAAFTGGILHFLCYLIIGLPLLIWLESPSGRHLWKNTWLLYLGTAFLGFALMLFSSGFLAQILGAAYGSISAITVVRVRNKVDLSRKDQQATPAHDPEQW